MLQGLFGNKSISKILLFLLVNETCYASQLHRVLGTPLTPIQKALERLERDQILTSHYAGKTRLFAFNPDYPLLNELEALLKQAYALMSPGEKKAYYYIRQPLGPQGRQEKTLLDAVWQRLKGLQSVSLEFRSSKKRFGHGEGGVEVGDDGGGVLTTRERGTWRREKESFAFCNTFRWTLNRIDTLLTLEHLRHGPKNPVFLFHLAPESPHHLESLHAHLCQKDTYFGALSLGKEGLELSWRILGPKKNEEIFYRYR